MKSNKILFKILGFVAAIIFSLLSFATDASNPVEAFLASNSNFKMKTNFSEDVKKLLGPKNNPALIKGDFNGDGITDYVAMLTLQPSNIPAKKAAAIRYDAGADQMVFFYSVGNGFDSKSKGVPKENNIYLTKISKTMVKSGLPKGKPRDLAQLETYYGPTTAYFVEGSEVVEFKGTLAPID